MTSAPEFSSPAGWVSDANVIIARYAALGRIGLWRSGALLTPELAAAVEQLGYGTVWIGG